MTQKNILFLWAKLVRDGKILGKGDGFPDSEETPSRKDFRAMTYYDYHYGTFVQQCPHCLSNCFGYYSPTCSTVHKWDKEVHFSRKTFEDTSNPWPLLPLKTTTTKVNVAKVKCLIKEDQQITGNETKDSFNLSSGSLNRILRHHLGVWKRCAHWVPHQLTGEQKKGRAKSCHPHAAKIWRRQVRAGLGHRHG